VRSAAPSSTTSAVRPNANVASSASSTTTASGRARRRLMRVSDEPDRPWRCGTRRSPSGRPATGRKQALAMARRPSVSARQARLQGLEAGRRDSLAAGGVRCRVGHGHGCSHCRSCAVRRLGVMATPGPRRDAQLALKLDRIEVEPAPGDPTRGRATQMRCCGTSASRVPPGQREAVRRAPTRCW
jgi:hypothetical protein